jgi:hypothetical protein
VIGVPSAFIRSRQHVHILKPIGAMPIAHEFRMPTKDNINAR